jgi:hypothetical protein
MKKGTPEQKARKKRIRMAKPTAKLEYQPYTTKSRAGVEYTHYKKVIVPIK